MYQISSLSQQDLDSYISFQRDIQTQYWTLSSYAFQRQPSSTDMSNARKITQESRDPHETTIYLLKRNHRIISSIKITNSEQKLNKMIFSHVETHPDYQKRGIFGLTLGNACLRMACESDCERVELTTWTFNRKGIPLYKRGGFRAVPGTSLLMENYLPLIVKHQDTQAYFNRHDYIRTLQNKRSYGYDAVKINGMSVFEYRWKARKMDDELRVLVDWQKKEIVDIECRITEPIAVVGDKSDV